ncbi:MAG TPA: TonB-dependent receptor [Pyrinomonadaceae bacterium]|jgi:outer membrane receptor protein involved in Fe transport
MKSRALRLLVIIFAVCIAWPLWSAAGVWAQDLDNVTIRGRVSDENGAIVPGASVTATLVMTGDERTVSTDGEGRYRIIELEPGVYTVSASFTNFATEQKTGLTTVAGQNVELNFTLRPAGVVAEQTVVSEADAPAVDTTRTVVGGTVTTEEIESLPVASRSPLDLIFTLGGVTEEPLSTRDLAEDSPAAGATANTPEEAGSFALSGGPAYSNNITIDGLDNNDDRAARERFQPSIEAVEEVQVITNQFSAEYGRASGGRINIRTRGGSNRYRGRAFYFFRNDIFNANTFRNNARGIQRLPLEQHNPGLTLSGPINLPRSIFGPFAYEGRSRTFFFAAYEFDTLFDTATIDTFVPVLQNPLFPLPAPTITDAATDERVSAPSTAARVAPFISGLSTPSRNNIFTLRIDHKFGELHNGSVLYQLGRLNNLRQFGGGDRLAESLQARTTATDAISYSDNYVFSPRLVNQARVQYSSLAPAVEARGDEAKPVVIINIGVPVPGTSDTDSHTLVAGSSTIGATDRRETRFQFQEALSFVAGSHSLKFGGDFQRINSTFIDLSDASGTFTFESAGDFLANKPSRFRQNFQTESDQHNTYMSVFVQDEWRLRPNLTFSFGVRYERETIIRDTNNFGPRLAVAYDPFSSGKTVIRLGAGIFYNRALLRTIDDFTLGQQQRFFDTNELVNATTGRVMSTTERRDFIDRNLRFPQVLTADSTLVAQNATLNTTFSRRLDPAIRIPESYQANVGFERELGRSIVFEANYTFNRGIHLWREFNANAPVLPSGFSSLTQYLLSRDFPNFRSRPGGPRPIYDASTAGELVRFTLAPIDPSNNITRIIEFGVPVTVMNLNTVNSTTVLNSSLDALRDLRPDPSREQIEQLASIGNSFYHGLTLELRRRFRASKSGFGFSIRMAYTLSRLIDDGIVNTSSALRAGDFRAERSRSLLDRRHRFVLSGTFDTPWWLGGLRLSPIFRLASGAPFNISIGGDDRNLDDVGNDRPSFNGDLSLLRSRNPGEPLNPALLSAFSLPVVGQDAGNLPRNAGIGPGIFLLDINITREFRIGKNMRLRPVIEIDNLLNKTVFSFGSQFIGFDALSPSATPEARQAFIDNFLVPTRTLRPRTVRIGVRYDF